MKSGIEIYGNKLSSVNVIFGGRIGVTYANTDKESVVILHQLDHSYPVGKTLPKESFKNHSHVSLVFNNIKSIEVVEKALKDAKKFLETK